MNAPPRHVVLFRWALVVAVVLVVGVTAVVLPWSDVLATLDLWTDGLVGAGP